MQLKLDARARRLLARLPVVNVYSLAELVLITGLAVQVARLFWTVVTPVSPLGDWRPAPIAVPGDPADVIAGFDPFFRLDPATAPTTVTALQLTLFGTTVNEASGRGSAIIAGSDGQQMSYAVGDEIAPGVKLKAVAFDHVTLDRGGADEDLFMVQGEAAPAAAGAPASPPAATPPPTLAIGGQGVPASQLRSEIGFIPRIDGGRVSGLVVRSQGTGTVFRQAGLRDGDVVTSIGGRPVTGLQDVDRVTADFAKGGSIPITVERGSLTFGLSIAVAPAS